MIKSVGPDWERQLSHRKCTLTFTYYASWNRYALPATVYYEKHIHGVYVIVSPKSQ